MGPLSIFADEDALLRISFGIVEGVADHKEHPILCHALKELKAYFSGDLKVFTVPLRLQGTEFQIKVWNALKSIHWGSRCTYGDIAERIGNTKASRAVGMANNKNPIPIIIPCHRVVGSSGKLVGYAGGLDVKQKLLALEQNQPDLFC